MELPENSRIYFVINKFITDLCDTSEEDNLICARKNPSGIVKMWNKTHSMFVGQNVKQVQDTKQFKHFFLNIKPKVNRHHNKTGDRRIGAYALPCFTSQPKSDIPMVADLCILVFVAAK